LKVCNIEFTFCIEGLMELSGISLFIHGQKKLQQAVEWPIKHSAAFAGLGMSPVRGILLHGPPGCSKTTLAKAAAHAAQASFFSLRFELFHSHN
jgi:SpoVK/Ycf46/Vps4 family AAA+-type ATPase